MADEQHATAPLIYLLAGEASGDALGARLMKEIAKQTGGFVRFAGIGGARMLEQGLESAFPISELSVMGLIEVVPHLPRLMRRINETAEQIERLRPAVLVTIDAPDFTLRISKLLLGKGIPLVHYVAPTVWAWKSDRARKTAEFLDHMIALFPFEPPYFETVGLDCTFVGHPVVEGGAAYGDGLAFRKQHDIPLDAPLLCALPGSRADEVKRLLPIYRTVFDLLSSDVENLHVAMPVADGMENHISDVVSKWDGGIILVHGDQEKFNTFAASDVAVAASGTVALELAVAQTPSVITYRLNTISAWLARTLVKVRYVNLVNLLLDEEVVPELVLEKCKPRLIAGKLFNLFNDADARLYQVSAAQKAIEKLSLPDITPSERAAQVVLAHVTQPSFINWRQNSR